ncbi:hypothetical protein PTKIN_Ptkin05aG0189900 [Pterospermum kingtungense]
MASNSDRNMEQVHDLPVGFMSEKIGHFDQFCEKLYDSPIPKSTFQYCTWLRASPRHESTVNGSKWLRLVGSGMACGDSDGGAEKMAVDSVQGMEITV